MTVTLVVPPHIRAVISSMLRVDVETGAVLGARIVHTEGGDLRLLGIGDLGSPARFLCPTEVRRADRCFARVRTAPRGD